MKARVRALTKAVILRSVALPGVADLGRRPILRAARFLERLSAWFYGLHRNLPQAARLADRSFDHPRQIAARYYLALRDQVREFPIQPKFSVIVPVYKVEPRFLAEALRSVAQQIYPHWEVCIVDDASGMPAIDAVIEAFAAAHPGQTKYAKNATNQHISATSNAALALATGDYVALLDHDDRLYPSALAEVVRYVNLHDGPDILYSDERVIDPNGDRLAIVYFKPDWSRFMHLSMNYTTHLSVYRRTLVDEIGGFRRGFEGSQDHDLMLRMVEASRKPVVHIPFCLYQWRSHPNSTANATGAKPYAASAGERAVKEALDRRGRPATVTYQPDTMQYRVDYAPLPSAPLVSIVIPSKNGRNLLERSIGSVLAKSTYANYEIVISDNGSDDPATRRFYDDLSAKLGDRFRLLLEPRPFNFGAQVNAGVGAAQGEYVLLLNDDTEVIAETWIEEMLALAAFPEVGAVGAKLLFGDGTIQHGGVVLSAQAIAEHSGILFPASDNLYWNVLNVVHETMAVTAACLMIAKAKYLGVGGFDERYLPRGYGDVDFCLKLGRQGLTNLYTPHARLFHHESASRGAAVEYFERFYMQSRWGGELANDPYLNPNLERGPRYKINKFYLDLDLGKKDFEFFLNTPIEQWSKVLR